MKPKLIALDLDGTLLTDDKRITPRCYAALRQAAEQGHYVVPATGRALHALPDVVKALRAFDERKMAVIPDCVQMRETGRNRWTLEVWL